MTCSAIKRVWQLEGLDIRERAPLTCIESQGHHGLHLAVLKWGPDAGKRFAFEADKLPDIVTPLEDR